MAMPTISMCSNGGSFRRGLCLPSACRSRTWQLVTCEENRQASGNVPESCGPTACQPPCLPAMSCVGFACQPICSYTTCESSTGQSPCVVSSCQPYGSESNGHHQAQCCGQPSSKQKPACASGSGQAACDQPMDSDSKPCKPPCSAVTSCNETPCPPSACVACPGQSSCCQAGSCPSMCCEVQSCQSTYYQPICYIFKPLQTALPMPVPCQSSPCVFNSCNPPCYVPSPCQPLYCQTAPSLSIMCQPMTPCSPPCSVTTTCKPASGGTGCSDPPTCGSTSCNQGGCQSSSCQPACCVTGVGKMSIGCSNGFQGVSTNVCNVSTCLPTSWKLSLESGFCKVHVHW